MRFEGVPCLESVLCSIGLKDGVGELMTAKYP